MQFSRKNEASGGRKYVYLADIGCSRLLFDRPAVVDCAAAAFERLHCAHHGHQHLWLNE